MHLFLIRDIPLRPERDVAAATGVPPGFLDDLSVLVDVDQASEKAAFVSGVHNGDGTETITCRSTIDFEGRNYEISDTKRKSVTIVHHPDSKFWVVEHPPEDVWPPVLGAYSL